MPKASILSLFIASAITLIQFNSASAAEVLLNMTSATSDGGYSYIIPVSSSLVGDSSSAPTVSKLQVFENGVKIGPAHSLHADIRNSGRGRFSHWGTQLYFSASDNSNPRSNGRKYSYTVDGTSPTPAPTATTVPSIALSTTSATSDGGYAYIIPVSSSLVGDSSSAPTASKLQVYENGVKIGPAHSRHADIRNSGRGRFSHWGTQLYFSASDNSNPRTNGRKYSYAVDGSVPTPAPSPTVTPAPSPSPSPTVTPVPTGNGPFGFAMVNGQTTGGAGGQTVTVSTFEALKSAVNSISPMIIQVSGKITGSGIIYVRSNKSIIGLSGSSVEGAAFSIYGESNVIIRNMTVRNSVTYTNITIKNNSHHVWIDHCTLSSIKIPGDWEYYDGLLDVGNESDYVTLSWNKLHDSHIPMLIGFGYTTWSDAGKLRITVHNNYFYNVDERQPAVRFGQVHFFNNYIRDSSGYAIEATMGANVRTDNNYFQNVRTPIRTDFSAYNGVTPTPGYITGASTNFYDSQSGSNIISTAPANWSPPYEFKSRLAPALDVPKLLIDGAGAR